MKLAAAVEMYVLHQRTMGQKFEGPAVALRAFCRRYGKTYLQAITSTDVKQFLDVPQTGPAAWRRKYGVLRDFFEYWRCREKLNAVPMPLAIPKSTQTFVPYIYSRRELRLLLDAVPRCQRSAACRTSAITLRTLLLFLYGTGMRVGEALRLRRLCTLAGVRRSDASSRQPRLHDLRHTFAVHRLTEWYRTGANVQVLLPALSTYLGHVDLHSTQCYLTMTPELLTEANRRFQDYVYGGRHEQESGPRFVDPALPDGIPRRGEESGPQYSTELPRCGPPPGGVYCR